MTVVQLGCFPFLQSTAPVGHLSRAANLTALCGCLNWTCHPFFTFKSKSPAQQPTPQDAGYQPDNGSFWPLFAPQLVFFANGMKLLPLCLVHTGIIFFYSTKQAERKKKLERSPYQLSDVSAATSPAKLLCSDPPPQHTDPRSQLLAASVDEMLAFHHARSIKVSCYTRFCWTGCCTRGTDVGRCLLNWLIFSLCVPAFTCGSTPTTCFLF